MDIRKLIFAVFRKWWLILILSFGFAALAGAYSLYFSVPTYVAEATIYSLNNSKLTMTGESINAQDIYLGQQLLIEYSQIINSRKVLTLALKELKDTNLTVDDLNRMVNLNMKKDSSVMAVSVSSYDPQLSAQVANAVSKAFTSKIRELSNNDSVGILDDAQVPEYPVSNGGMKKILIGFMAGAVLALALIYINELFDTTIRSAEDLELGLKIRVIGIIPEHDIH